jgi:2-keto-4-pentenoate hydratase/2-oxohepta-3-ene-1,7-dioic acid hydratase in catechol pathway
METGNWLKPGDTLELAIDGVGSLSATVGDRRRTS